jgi:hypothetical protein
MESTGPKIGCCSELGQEIWWDKLQVKGIRDHSLTGLVMGIACRKLCYCLPRCVTVSLFTIHKIWSESNLVLNTKF